MEIEILARAALGNLVPPEPALDFDLLDEEVLEKNRLEEPRPLGSGESLPDGCGTCIPSTTAEITARLDLPKPGHMEVACPNCSTAGLVPWNRLDGVLCCSGCWTWFRIGSDGRKTVVDPPAASRGALRHYSRNGSGKPKPLVEKRQTVRHPLTWPRIGPLLMTLLPVALLGALLYVGGRWWSKPRLTKLPVELDRRARLLVESWLKHDTALMVRLAHPNCRGITRRWAFDHRPPGQLDPRRAGIDVRVLRQDEETAEVEVSLEFPGRDGMSERKVLHQHWNVCNGNWCFHPAYEPAPPAAKLAEAPHGGNPRRRSK